MIPSDEQDAEYRRYRTHSSSVEGDTMLKCDRQNFWLLPIMDLVYGSSEESTTRNTAT